MVDNERIEMSVSAVQDLQETVEELRVRVACLEGCAAPWLARPRTSRPSAAPVAGPVKPDRAPAPASGPPAPSAPARRTASLEDLIGGRLLAWAGGLAVLAGVVLLFAIAVSNGWIGEEARTLIAAAGALALGASGVWLHEQRGRTEAALVATATSIAALFTTVAVASQVYGLVPGGAGAVMAVLVGSAATALALRWRAQGIAALGIVGGLLAPVLAGADATFGSMLLLFAAAAAASAVVVDRRWAWLAGTAFLVTTPQWVAYLLDDPATLGGLVVLVAFGALNAAAAVGHELRARSETLAPWSSALLAVNAVVLAGAGWLLLDDRSGAVAANAWLAGLAVAHIAAGYRTLRSPRMSHVVGVSLVSVGVLLADLALGLILDGTPRALAYAGGAVTLAGLVRRLRPAAHDSAVLGAGLGGHLCLAILQLVLTDARPELLGADQAPSVATLAAVLALAAACFSAARLVRDEGDSWRIGLDALGLVIVAYLTALSADGVALAVAWSGEAAGLAFLTRRHPDRVSEAGAAGLGLLALGHALAIEAPPVALIDGLPDMIAAATALACSSVVALVWPALGVGDQRRRAIGVAVAAVALLYLLSTEIVTAFAPDVASAAAPVLELGIRQQGQVLVSALWALTGTIAVIVGLRRDLRPLRLGALGLLLAALTKLVTYDLSTLTSVYRVGSCVVIGMLLLLTAFAWQRLRPRTVPDLRTMPPGLR